MTIGELARRAGVKAQTIRFYEREGLVPVPARSAAGYRRYPAEAVERVRFIRAAKEVGFTLEEISAGSQPHGTSARVFFAGSWDRPVRSQKGPPAREG